MEGELVRDSPQATTLPNSQKGEGRLNFWDIALLDLFGEGRGHEPEAQKVAPAIPLTTPSKSSSHACSHRWGCKYKCSFVGSFAEVEEHERICLKGQGPKEHKDENKKMQLIELIRPGLHYPGSIFVWKQFQKAFLNEFFRISLATKSASSILAQGAACDEAIYVWRKRSGRLRVAEGGQVVFEWLGIAFREG